MPKNVNSIKASQLQNGYSNSQKVIQWDVPTLGMLNFSVWHLIYLKNFHEESSFHSVSECVHMCVDSCEYTFICISTTWVCQVHVWKLDDNPKFWFSYSTLFELHPVLFAAEHTRLAGLWTSRKLPFLPLASPCLEY